MKNKFFLVLTAILTFSFIIVVRGYSAFEFTSLGTRATGLGGAFVALADDGSSVLYNPAGIRQILNYTVSFSYLKPYLGLPNINLGFLYFNYIQPIRKLGSMGFTYLNYDGNGQYSESAYIFSYGLRLNEFYRDIDIPILCGVNVKMLQHKFNWDDKTKTIAATENDPVILTGDNKTNFSLDLGLVLRFSRNIYLGMAVTDINQPNLGLYYDDIIPLNLRAGVGLKKTLSKKTFILSCDVTYRNQQWGTFSDKLSVNIGNEIWFTDLLAVRYGINPGNISAGASYLKPLSTNQLQIDYSFQFPFYLPDNTGTHNFTLTFKFGKPVTEEIEDKSKLKEDFIDQLFKEQPIKYEKKKGSKESAPTTTPGKSTTKPVKETSPQKSKSTKPADKSQKTNKTNELMDKILEK